MRTKQYILFIAVLFMIVIIFLLFIFYPDKYIIKSFKTNLLLTRIKEITKTGIKTDILIKSIYSCHVSLSKNGEKPKK